LEENWELQKMGVWISPEKIIGSPLISAIDKAVKNPSFEIVIPLEILIASVQGFNKTCGAFCGPEVCLNPS
jgi:hypothetical protein